MLILLLERSYSLQYFCHTLHVPNPHPLLAIATLPTYITEYETLPHGHLVSMPCHFQSLVAKTLLIIHITSSIIYVTYVIMKNSSSSIFSYHGNVYHHFPDKNLSPYRLLSKSISSIVFFFCILFVRIIFGESVTPDKQSSIITSKEPDSSSRRISTRINLKLKLFNWIVMSKYKRSGSFKGGLGVGLTSATLILVLHCHHTIWILVLQSIYWNWFSIIGLGLESKSVILRLVSVLQKVPRPRPYMPITSLILPLHLLHWFFFSPFLGNWRVSFYWFFRNLFDSVSYLF